MNTLRQDVSRIQELTAGAFQQTGGLSVLANIDRPDAAKLEQTLEQTLDQFERATLELRKLAERHATGVGGYGGRPMVPPMENVGFVETFGYNWLHIQLNTLLPHCRFQTPEWLSDSIRRLLDDYESCGNRLPWFTNALMVIDEHCGIAGRHIFDQDNKGWKAVSNAIKGRLIPDDDQHTLSLALLSSKSELDVCHITLLDKTDAADFFAYHSGDYAAQDFYGGTWGW